MSDTKKAAERLIEPLAKRIEQMGPHEFEWAADLLRAEGPAILASDTGFKAAVEGLDTIAGCGWATARRALYHLVNGMPLDRTEGE